MSKVSAYSSLTAPTSGAELYVIDSSGNSRKMKLAHALAAMSSIVAGATGSSGCLFYINSSAELAWLAKGSSGYVMQSSGNIPKWTSPIKYVNATLFSTATALASGPAAYIQIPPDVSGYNLTYVSAYHFSTAASAGNTIINVYNQTDGSSMLSSYCEISSGTIASSAASSQVLIDSSKDDVVTGDIIRIDVTGIPSASAPKGLAVTLGFSLP